MLPAVCRYGFPIKCTNVVFADDNETVREIHAEYDPEKKSKPPKVLFFSHLYNCCNFVALPNCYFLFLGGSTLGS